MKLTNAHLVVSSFAALAGVVIAAYQAFAPTPKQVAVPAAAPQEANASTLTVAKSDAGGAIETDIAVVEPSALEPGQGIVYAAALNDGSDKRYAFADIFDGKPETVVTIAAPDNEIDVLVDFSGQGAQTVTGFEYSPPQGGADSPATTLDVMVLPEGRLEPSGRPVMSFTLQTTPGKQTFSLPAKELGKALFLRIAGPQTAQRVTVGDFRILRAD